MEGAINWAALPLLIEIYGVEDIEALHRSLRTIRDHLKRKNGNAT